MNRIGIMSGLLAVLVSCLALRLAVAESAASDCLESTGHAKICCPEVVVKKAKQSCWEVECKEVCIPRVQFPWMKCDEPRCGRVRTVRVLKKREFEVEKQETRWKIQDLYPRCEQPANAPEQLPAAAADEPTGGEDQRGTTVNTPELGAVR